MVVVMMMRMTCLGMFEYLKVGLTVIVEQTYLLCEAPGYT